MDDIAFADCGDNFTLAVTTGGELYAWGCNEFGQLGDGSTQDKDAPVKIMDGVKLAAGGSSHTLILGDDGRLWSCGSAKFGQLGLGKTADSLKAAVGNERRKIDFGGWKLFVCGQTQWVIIRFWAK